MYIRFIINELKFILLLLLFSFSFIIDTKRIDGLYYNFPIQISILNVLNLNYQFFLKIFKFFIFHFPSF